MTGVQTCALPISQHAIVTDAWARSRPTFDVDVLIDARGWRPIDLPAFPPVAKSADHTVELVDISDRFCFAAKKLSSRRAKEYARRGWDC